MTAVFTIQVNSKKKKIQGFSQILNDKLGVLYRYSTKHYLP